MELVQGQLAKDKLLLEYFEFIKDETKAKMVKFRIECTEKELSGDIEE